MRSPIPPSFMRLEPFVDEFIAVFLYCILTTSFHFSLLDWEPLEGKQCLHTKAEQEIQRMRNLQNHVTPLFFWVIKQLLCKGREWFIFEVPRDAQCRNSRRIKPLQGVQITSNLCPVTPCWQLLTPSEGQWCWQRHTWGHAYASCHSSGEGNVCLLKCYPE